MVIPKGYMPEGYMPTGYMPSTVNADTENKRRSVPNLIVLITMPVAGTANSENNRKHSCWLYRGPGDDPSAAVRTKFIPSIRRRRR